MLYYMHLKLKKLMLVLTSNVSGYTILIELYGAHVIYVIVCFFQWLIWIRWCIWQVMYASFDAWINGMGYCWLVGMYYVIE
jgi:hypothetical protein